MHALLLALLAAAPPAVGDATHGAALYRVNCAACHGATGAGDGPMAHGLPVPPGRVTGTAFQMSETGATLHDVIAHGSRGALMPAFGSELSALEVWDLVAYLRQGALPVTDFFPGGARYLVKRYTVDAYGQKRLDAVLASPVTPAQAAVEVVTVFNGTLGIDGEALLEPQDPVTLDSLKPKDRLGYIAFVNAKLPGDAAPLLVAIAADRTGKIVKAVSLAGVGDAKRDKLLAAYVGQGKKGPHVALEGAKGNRRRHAKSKAAEGKLSGFDAAYATAMEGITMYDKEERDRTWADGAK